MCFVISGLVLLLSIIYVVFFFEWDGKKILPISNNFCLKNQIWMKTQASDDTLARSTNSAKSHPSHGVIYIISWRSRTAYCIKSKTFARPCNSIISSELGGYTVKFETLTRPTEQNCYIRSLL